MSGRVLAFSFPNPFDLLGALVSPLLNLGGAVAGSIVEDVIEGLAAAVVGALVDLAAGIMGFFWDAAEPQLQSSWFHGSPDASYDQMVVLAAPLLVVFVFAGIVQGALKGDIGGMLRMTALRLPGAVLAMSVTVAVGDLLLAVTDDMSAALLTGFQDDITQVGVLLSRVGLAAGSAPAMVLELVFAAVGLLAAAAVVVELFVRAALVYLVAAFSPLVYAASVWEPLRGSVRKLAELALALILSKLAIAVALAVSAAAVVGTLPDPGTSTALPTPEQAAAQADQPLAQTIGILVSAVVMFCVAAFMPFVLWRLLPLAEGASVAHGVRGAPLRGAFMASSMASMATNNPATALLRSRQQGAGRGAAANVAAAAANPAAGAAKAGASAANKGAKGAKAGTRAGAGSSGPRQGGKPNGSSSGSGQGRGSSGPSRRRGGAPGGGGGGGGGGGSGGRQSARPTGGTRGDGGPASTQDRPGQRSQRSQPSPRPGRGPGSNGSPRNGGDR